MKFKNWIIGFLIFGILVIGGYMYFKNKNSKAENDKTASSDVGEKVEDKGRDHVTDIYGVEYSSNPPTSGPHFPVWAKAGIYDRLISDGYLIHSLEHGYIVISYDCSKVKNTYKLIPDLLAHDEPLVISSESATPLMHMNFKPQGTVSWFTAKNAPFVEKELPPSFKSSECDSLVQELKPFLDISQRVVIVPRMNMDTKLAITVWNRVLKLDGIDKEKMETFIKTYHNKAPEQTIE